MAIISRSQNRQGQRTIGPVMRKLAVVGVVRTDDQRRLQMLENEPRCLLANKVLIAVTDAFANATLAFAQRST